MHKFEWSTIPDPSVVSFDGQCRYGSDEKQWMDITTSSTASECRNECKNVADCTAVVYDSTLSPGLCSLYKGGPYTYGKPLEGNTCYPMEGILSFFL